MWDRNLPRRRYQLRLFSLLLSMSITDPTVVVQKERTWRAADSSNVFLYARVRLQCEYFGNCAQTGIKSQVWNRADVNRTGPTSALNLILSSKTLLEYFALFDFD